MNQLEERIADLVREKGPLTGAEIHQHIKGDSLAVWQACRTSRALETRTLGRLYLRLDAQVEGYARLSPSILREFFTYSLVGLPDDPEPLEARRREIAARIEAISREKHDLARRFIEDIRERFGNDWPEEKLCVILAGDVVYRMAHRVPRPERSTGRLVDGSDLDLVVILADDVPDSFVERLDDAIYKSKYVALVTPSVREEIDYVVKKMARVEEQLQFDTFKRMVACKILHEGVLLHGSGAMFDAIQARLREKGIARRLEDLETQAHEFRKAGQDYLLRHCPTGRMESDIRKLFYSAEESEEFE
ncbi:conserved hypothetical protein [uncultured delta proteobacterium]|uniref:Uncharacterized protein n=1 Tax=uncultured delta proteobacterium TaxID=34034 RepID=A0A212JAQ3_9DELT|nr:conserved hypothetical protein [uncultured delta proteobacterium]